eukprot:gnl/TRDRNA2_/TRDRNA2_180846_c0_seq1.p1 gnl/TRDRNA2_/TRDRNA2_180846_c0~~gnl/TRDRNA2_/TRDRNA2_180846_c0_seq1.p1  ORF type:complete len:236 (-),score=67.30 gnl/TRDRNA2_/TRDRNA2_180846_c0_seq1:65-772(-)
MRLTALLHVLLGLWSVGGDREVEIRGAFAGQAAVKKAAVPPQSTAAKDDDEEAGMVGLFGEDDEWDGDDWAEDTSEAATTAAVPPPPASQLTAAQAPSEKVLEDTEKKTASDNDGKSIFKVQTGQLKTRTDEGPKSGKEFFKNTAGLGEFMNVATQKLAAALREDLDPSVESAIKINKGYDDNLKGLDAGITSLTVGVTHFQKDAQQHHREKVKTIRHALQDGLDAKSVSATQGE